jgi:hypothetical protein
MNDKQIPILDSSDEDFEQQLDFALWSTQGSSDYRNDRERPYNGQSWTSHGKRGQTEVKGLTMRDIEDCFIMALLDSCASEKYLELDEFSKCWDFSECLNEDDKPKPTEYLLQKQKENDPDYISTKVDTGNWRYQDVYHIDLNNIDPLAVARNLTCRIEKMMDIFPNISPNK